MTEKHETYHGSQAEERDGRRMVVVGCSCGWRDWVDVTGEADKLKAMTAIWGARDAHELEATGKVTP
jgi:hypothetical protein